MKKSGLVYFFMIACIFAFAQQAEQVSPMKTSGKTDVTTKPQANPNASPSPVAKQHEGNKRNEKSLTNSKEAPSPVKKATK